MDWTDEGFNKSFDELVNVLGNLLNRVLNMVNKYRGGVIPKPTAFREKIDEDLEAAIANLAPRLQAAYDRCELQQCAMLPVELARQANGYVEVTRPFTLAKDLNQANRLDTVLYLLATASYHALVGLLPLLPAKAAVGLEQLGVNLTGRTLQDLFAHPLAAGAKVGIGQPLFPRVETK